MEKRGGLAVAGKPQCPVNGQRISWKAFIEYIESGDE
jgi:hypothetical protein